FHTLALALAQKFIHAAPLGGRTKACAATGFAT
ncbi:MAG: hypothetical protein JWM91_4251, partial [Rhodospirillales bacterium]|nr:hypothetical protein [Rhodospirillales bacterium]